MGLNRKSAKFISNVHKNLIAFLILVMDPHIGHLYTVLLGDAIHRWRVLCDESYGRTVNHLFVVGTDEHGKKAMT